MLTATLDRIACQFAITSISAYQKYISPHKGFACAHRVLHQGESCSQYVKRLLGEQGLFEAIQGSRQRFLECKEANETLKESQKNSQTNQKKKCKNTKNSSKSSTNWIKRPTQKKKQTDQNNLDLGSEGVVSDDCYNFLEWSCDGSDCVPNLDCNLGSGCDGSDCVPNLDCTSGMDCGSCDFS